MTSSLADKASAAFKKPESRREGEVHLTAYKAAKAAEDKKTERLRAQRLERDAAQAKASAAKERR